MKKFILAILSFLYLAVSTGATINLHYCMDKYTGWDLKDSHHKKCDNCGMQKSASAKKGCCKEEQKRVKLQTDQKTTETTPYQPQWEAIVQPLPVYGFSSLLLSSSIQQHPPSHSPPLFSDGIYLLNCVFRI